MSSPSPGGDHRAALNDGRAAAVLTERRTFCASRMKVRQTRSGSPGLIYMTGRETVEHLRSARDKVKDKMALSFFFFFFLRVW